MPEFIKTRVKFMDDVLGEGLVPRFTLLTLRNPVVRCPACDRRIGTIRNRTGWQVATHAKW